MHVEGLGRVFELERALVDELAAGGGQAARQRRLQVEIAVGREELVDLVGGAHDAFVLLDRLGDVVELGQVLELHVDRVGQRVYTVNLKVKSAVS